MSFDLGLMLHTRERKRAFQAGHVGKLGRVASLEEEDKSLNQYVHRKEFSDPNVRAQKNDSEHDNKDDDNMVAQGSSKVSSPDWTRFESAYARELFPAGGGGHKTQEFLLEVTNILIDYVHKNNDRSKKILDFHHPHQLREMMDHCLDLHEDPRDLEQILSDCKETLKYCVKTGHPRFFNQLSQGLDIVALAGEWLTATANTNMFTYEVAPVFTLMEDIVLTKMRDIVGWSDGDGIFAPGGAIANLYAVLAARHRCCPEQKAQGMCGLTRLVMFTSEHSHFSTKRAAAIAGIGTDNCIAVKCDERGKMIPGELEKCILQAKSEGAKPFYVTCTTGSTVLGAFDPINEIADICETYGMWMHVDAAWGGGALLSERYRHLFNGVERCDSITWNPHKMMGVTLQCSAILLKEKDILKNCNSMCADYLYQQDKHYDVVYDTGDKAIQCGRHNDIFKLWLMWRAKGDKGLESQINRVFELAKYLTEKIRERPGFMMVMDEPEYTNVCFWYVPSKIRHLEQGKERDDELSKVAPRIKSMMMEGGSTLVGYQPLGKKPNFFRMVISNPAATKEDIDFLLEEVERLGEEI
ncbi:unnamed protein product [Owenia fusiformis]|uniref:Uncharacterized protein n=1 Tax=Owenia fusiformis TaxID=6347 RepID=A0A8J1U915_OWEFU|nr:unnamed protein product [Owenia fusiformis]